MLLFGKCQPGLPRHDAWRAHMHWTVLATLIKHVSWTVQVFMTKGNNQGRHASINFHTGFITPIVYPATLNNVPHNYNFSRQTSATQDMAISSNQTPASITYWPVPTAAEARASLSEADTLCS